MVPEFQQGKSNRLESSTTTPSQDLRPCHSAAASSSPAPSQLLADAELRLPSLGPNNSTTQSGRLLRRGADETISRERASEPNRSRFDTLAEYLTGLRTIAPGVIAQVSPQSRTIGIHLVPPKGSRSLGPRQKAQLRENLVDVAARSENLRDCIAHNTIKAVTPSKPALRILIDVFRRMHQDKPTKDTGPIQSILDIVKRNQLISAEAPITTSGGTAQLALSSFRPSLLQRASYGMKAILGLYPKAGNWYCITSTPHGQKQLDAEQAESHSPPTRALFGPYQWMVSTIAKYGGPISLNCIGASVAMTAPYLTQSYYQIALGGIIGGVGVAAAVLAWVCHDRVERRAAKWFAVLNGSTQTGEAL